MPFDVRYRAPVDLREEILVAKEGEELHLILSGSLGQNKSRTTDARLG